jgi:hypothetical protein
MTKKSLSKAEENVAPVSSTPQELNQVAKLTANRHWLDYTRKRLTQGYPLNSTFAKLVNNLDSETLARAYVKFQRARLDHIRVQSAEVE